MLVVVLRFQRRAPLFCFGALWFLICLLPTNSILPRYDVAIDRQLYLALLGPTLVFGVAVVRSIVSFEGSVRSVSTAVGMCLLMGLLATAIWQRNLVYATEVSFWKDVSLKSPSSARAGQLVE